MESFRKCKREGHVSRSLKLLIHIVVVAAVSRCRRRRCCFCMFMECKKEKRDICVYCVREAVGL